MVDKQPWPDHLVLEGFITGDVASSGVVGKIARAPVLAREPITLSKLADADQPGFLAYSLKEGMRAMTLATDAVSGIAGYVFPGDRVDVLFVHNLTGESSLPAVSEVIAADVRVLAINLRDPSITSAVSSMVTGSGGAPSTITVEVSEEMAQKLRLAEKVGSLSLTLRSIRDKGKGEAVAATHLGSLSHEYMTGGTGESVRIIRGVGEKNTPEPAAVQGAGGGGLSGILGGILR
jgi:pilus assembly protein CpaB